MTPKRQKIYGILTIVFGMVIMYTFAFIQNKRLDDSYPTKIFSQEPLMKGIPPLPQTPTKQEWAQRKHISTMFWNVQNLFDTQNDPLKEDEEFTPEKNWTDSVYQAKLTNLAEIILRADDGFGPDILGLCEVENLSVLKDLAKHPHIQHLGYNYYCHRDGKDPRGIDVAIISRLPSSDISWHFAGNSNREILKAKYIVDGHELYVLVNHWRSRLGGKKKTQGARIEAARACRNVVLDILSENPVADIIIMGDFNDNPRDVSVQVHLMQGKKSKDLRNLTVWFSKPKWVHTEDYNFDQIIISNGLMDKIGWQYVPNSFMVLAFRHMCTKDGGSLKFSVEKLHGYSDHFPVLAQFILTSPKAN